ncbi:MAG TPA: shikimate kinase [Acidobacteriaceae bacterium]|nr:shikimate kinase [Acidobacteriaceae bacterium]
MFTGFMGAGKSTIGSQVAAALGWPFLDLDEEIVLAQGASISSLFDALGEPAFRELESSALAAALRRDNLVLALGGGALEPQSNRDLLSGTPTTLLIYLEAPLELLFSRCEQQSRSQTGAAHRPVLDNRASATERFLRRRPLYETAGWRVDTSGRSASEVTSVILERWDQLLADRA